MVPLICKNQDALDLDVIEHVITGIPIWDDKQMAQGEIPRNCDVHDGNSIAGCWGILF